MHLSNKARTACFVVFDILSLLMSVTTFLVNATIAVFAYYGVALFYVLVVASDDWGDLTAAQIVTRIQGDYVQHLTLALSIVILSTAMTIAVTARLPSFSYPSVLWSGLSRIIGKAETAARRIFGKR